MRPYQGNFSKDFCWLVIIALFLVACTNQKNTEKSFRGDNKAVELAEEMFQVIGGKQGWCDLKSLYIKANHTEPQMSIPYQSEIWRAIDRFELVIEQQNDSFHVKGVINPNEGMIRYYDKRDTMRILSEEQLEGWEFDHQHNIYVLLHDLGCDPDRFTAQLEGNGRLSFYQDTVLRTSFELDDELRPHIFYVPNAEGVVTGSKFTNWGTHDGLVHSAGGHPLDSNFIYTTEIWKPDTLSLKEVYGEDLFTVD